jgi:hypothetical protein
MLAGLVAIAAWSRGEYTVEEDAFDHIGYVRRIIDTNSMRPDGVLALPADAAESLPPDPRKGALHPTVAWIASLSSANPATVWPMLPLVLYPAFVLALVSFSRVLLPSRRLLIACVALFMLSYGGTAFQFAHAAAYGQNLAAAWYWMIAAAVLSATGPHIGRRAVVIAILALGGTLVHVGVALHGVVLAATLLMFSKWLGIDGRRARMDALVLVVAAFTGVVARVGLSPNTANLIHSHVQGVLFVGDKLFVMSPMEILRQYGMVFLGGLLLVPGLALVARRRGDARAVLALCTLPLLIAFVPPLASALFAKGSYMVFRSLLNAPVFAASAMVLAWAIGSARRRGVLTRVLTTIVIAAWVIAFVRPAFDATVSDTSRRRSPTMDDGTRALIRYLEFLPGNPTIASDPATAYRLSAYCPNKFVALYEQHANPRDPYAIDRLQAARDIVSPFADAARAVDACRRYAVDYVVLSSQALSSSPGFMTSWDPMLFPAAVARLRGAALGLEQNSIDDDFVVFRVFPVPPTMPPDGAAPPVFAASSELEPCTVMAPDRAFEITGVEVTPSPAAPGDSIVITIGYRRDEDIPFGLPDLAHVRFDHESLGSSRPFPGEKYARRFEDRRRGIVTRFRADFRPGRGVYALDLWPHGIPLRERVGVVVPANAVPGRYRVEVRVVRDSLLPNFHARDLLYNRDHYSGTACGWLDVGGGDR